MTKRRHRWLVAFLRGAGSVLDLGGVLAPRLEDGPLGLSPAEQDRRALAADGEAVGNDLRQTLEKERRRNG